MPFVGRMGLGAAIMIATVAVGAVTILPVLMGAFARRLRPRKPEHVAPVAALRALGHDAHAPARGSPQERRRADPASCSRRRSPRCGWASPTTATTRRARPRASPTTVWRRASAPASTARSCWPPRCPPARTAAPTLKRIEARRGAHAGRGRGRRPAQLNERGDAATIAVIPKSSPQDERTSKLVDSACATTCCPRPPPTRARSVYVGGATAIFDDLATKIASRLPVFIVLVVGLSVILLMAVFRSVWVPLVSAAFNLLSILAAYGVVVAVFQNGLGASLLGVDGEVPIVSFVPLFMFAILFGLSMDYNVFLQSRIREEYQRGAGARESVVIGLSRVARVILAAGDDHGRGLPRLRERPRGRW